MKYLLLFMIALSVQAGTHIDILSEHKICKIDSDCASVYTTCHYCECESAVGKDWVEHYIKERQKLCSDYQGEICDVNCPQQAAKCIKNVCHLVEVDKSEKSKKIDNSGYGKMGRPLFSK